MRLEFFAVLRSKCLPDIFLSVIWAMQKSIRRKYGVFRPSQTPFAIFKAKHVLNFDNTRREAFKKELKKIKQT